MERPACGAGSASFPWICFCPAQAEGPAARVANSERRLSCRIRWLAGCAARLGNGDHAVGDLAESEGGAASVLNRWAARADYWWCFRWARRGAEAEERQSARCCLTRTDPTLCRLGCGFRGRRAD